MELYLFLNMPIQVGGKWFLPFEQYPLVRKEMVPMVAHNTRSGYRLIPQRVLEPHYVVLRDGQEYSIPEVAGVTMDFLIPEEWVRRQEYWHSLGSDNIRDYIKAAADYLNIEIRYRPEAAGWYRKQLEEARPVPERDIPGDKFPKDIK